MKQLGSEKLALYLMSRADQWKLSTFTFTPNKAKKNLKEENDDFNHVFDLLHMGHVSNP